MSTNISKNKKRKDYYDQTSNEDNESIDKNEELESKKITSATGSGENTPMIDNYNNPLNIKQNLNGNNKKLERKILLNEIKSKNEELSKKIQNLYVELEHSKYLTVQNTNHCNEKIKDQKREIENLKFENENLVSQLKQLKTKINNRLKEAQIFYNKIEQLNKNEKNLNKELKIKKKLIELAKKNYEIIIRDYESGLKTKEIVENISKSELQQNLLLLQKEITNLESEIKNLNEIKAQHKFCEKKNNDLKNKLNIITNSYQFELKINNMYNNEENNIIKSKYNTSVNSIEKNNDPFKNRVLRKKKNSSLNKTNTNLKKYVNGIINSSTNHSRNSQNLNYSYLASFNAELFHKNERMTLNKIIPNYYLNICNDRYQSITQMKDEVSNLIEKNSKKKKNLIGLYNNKFNYSLLQIKENRKVCIELNSKFTKNTKKIVEIKEKINELNKESKKFKKLIKEKNKNREILKEQINEIKKKVKHEEENEKEERNGEEEKDVWNNKLRDYRVEKQMKLNY